MDGLEIQGGLPEYGGTSIQTDLKGSFWIGQDGNVWVSGPDGVNSAGPIDGNTVSYWLSRGFLPVADPNPGGTQTTATTNTTTGGGGGGGTTKTAAEIAEEARIAAENAERGTLKSEISGYQDDIDNLYTELFAELDTLVKERMGELQTQYGDQLGKAGSQYAAAIPEIETSYAALGAADSTDNTYAKNNAKTGFDETTKTIGKNKSDDEAALGKYATETKTKFQTDKDTATTNIGRAGQTEDVSALRGMRNDLETNLSSGRNTKATLGTDAGAKGQLKVMTADGGRYEAAIGALDEVINSSLSGGVKQAAVKAITDSAGLSDEEKAKVDEQYGNVYQEQAAL